jgi:hypothetical protein
MPENAIKVAAQVVSWLENNQNGWIGDREGLRALGKDIGKDLVTKKTE